MPNNNETNNKGTKKKGVSSPEQFPHTHKKEREQEKRTGPDGRPGKAGRVQGKGKAGTSHKATGGKGAR